MPRKLLLAAWIGFAAAAAAAADPIVFKPFGGDETLRPDAAVEVQWSGTPGGVGEMELLLSLDGGRHFPIRITPDLDADRGSYTWRVPSFPSGDARLAMRVNLGGREVLAGVSARFRIAADRAARPRAMRARGGEVWVTGLESAADDDGATFDSGCGAAEPRLAARWRGAALLAPPTFRPVVRRPAPLPTAASGRQPALLPAPSAGRGCRPLASPLRI